MAARRAQNNGIRGPQSALTDYLASNNISAVQIRRNHEQRRQQALVDQTTNPPEQENIEPADEPSADEVEEAIGEQKRRRKEAKAIAKIKNSKSYRKRKLCAAGEPEGDDEDLAWDMYTKSKPLPGQLENCEICSKRFTVTAYSKSGPEGGLLCTKCSKEQEAERRNEAKTKKKPVAGAKLRQIQSNLLNGIVRSGSKTLQELCVEKVADHINDVDEFGNLPQRHLDSLSQILSRKRVVDGRTLDLFLRPDLDKVAIYDCGKLEVADFVRIFSFMPKLEYLNLRQAGQVKDEVMDYILDRQVPLKELQLDASNLVSDDKWREFFKQRGQLLETLKLSWLDNSMDNETAVCLVQSCPNLKRLKLKKCFRLGEAALDSISYLPNLEHLSLQFVLPTSAEALTKMIRTIGRSLRTLSLERFENADDSTIEAIHRSCRQLTKLRFTNNDLCTDEAFVALFKDWDNPPLKLVDLSSNRDIDYTKPEGPDRAIGLASDGFVALMTHSGSKLESLDISSCRHIANEALLEVFDGTKQYPALKYMNISFLQKVDTPIVAGMFKSCPTLSKLTAFACVSLKDVIVPTGMALIGVPNPQDSIVQEGGFSVDDWNTKIKEFF